MFHMCWALSDGSSKRIPIDEQPNHQIVHLFRLGKAKGATHEPLNPGPEIDVLALDFLCVLLAYVMLLWVDMPLVGAPSVRVKLRDAKGLQELLQLEEDGVFAPSEYITDGVSRLQTKRHNRPSWPPCHSHALLPNWSKASPPTRHGGAYDH